MKIICIVATPHGKKGSTAGLMNEVLKGARSKGAKAETIVLKGGNVNPCRGCDRCHVKGRCPQKDDFNRILEKIMDADGLILASPNYIDSVSAQMKAFFDRCCGPIHCMAFSGKYGASVVTSGGGPEKPIAAYMNDFLVKTGVTPVGSAIATMGELPDGQFSDAICQQAFTLGENLVTAWKRKKRYKRIDRQMDACRQRMQQLVTWRREEWPYEYAYWQRVGMAG